MNKNGLLINKTDFW